MQSKASLVEIFSSLQGEGPHTGTPMTFVRFAGCSLNCRWCDTEASIRTPESFRVENPPRSKKFSVHLNPVSVKELNSHLNFFSDETISVTGGEPLEQADFLAEWLPTATKKILLETNGIFYEELAKVSKFVGIISMDIKLPSSTNKKAFWDEHSKFLSAAIQSGKETYIKLVVTADTLGKDIQEAIKVIVAVNKFVPVIIQPAGDTEKFSTKASNEALNSFARLCNLWLPNVSIMKQWHKEAGLL